MGFQGPAFTWNNKRSGMANIQERLDRGLINGPGRLLFPQASITHLLALNSDHRPLLMHTSPNLTSLPRPFHFESMWVREPSASNVVLTAWSCNHNGSPPFRLVQKLKKPKIALKVWNRTYCGHVHSHIKSLRDSINCFQNLPQTPSDLFLEQIAQNNLNEILKQEELFWRDKSRTKWLVDGDSNTRYFHISTIFTVELMLLIILNSLMDVGLVIEYALVMNLSIIFRASFLPPNLIFLIV